MSALAAVSAAVTLALTGAMAGLFYAFSVSVMPGLDGTRSESAIPAMQSINRKIQNPVFFVAFLGTPIAAVMTGVLLLALGQTRAAILLFLAAATYLVGTLAPTAVVNVPMNNSLDVASVPADAGGAAELWSDYSTRWTRWNTLRGVFNFVSLLLVGLGLFVWGRQG